MKINQMMRDKESNLLDTFRTAYYVLILCHQIYGDFHPSLTEMQIKLFQLKQRLSMEQLNQLGEAEKAFGYRIVKKSAVITHGKRSKIFREIKKIKTLPDK